VPVAAAEAVAPLLAADEDEPCSGVDATPLGEHAVAMSTTMAPADAVLTSQPIVHLC
jgi:hypothetical protein